jgi:hypothetical protein
VGRLVFGFLGGYVQEEGIQTGTRYFFLQLVQHLPRLGRTSVALYLAFTLIAFSGLAFWSWKAGNRDSNRDNNQFWTRTFHLPEYAAFLPGVLFLPFAMMLAFSPHYPWYVAWLIPFCVLLPNVSVLAYALGLFYLSATPLGAGTSDSQYRLNCLLYTAVFIVVLFEMSIRIWLDRRSAVVGRTA